MQQTSAIIIGSPLVGKTTLVKYIRTHSPLKMMELDEEIIKENNGFWPKDEKRRTKLLEQVTDKLLASNDFIFFTSYFPKAGIQELKEKGILVIQLTLPLEELLRRNDQRMKENDEPSTEEYIHQNLEFQTEIKDEGFVDHIISANTTTENIAERIFKLLGSPLKQR